MSVEARLRQIAPFGEDEALLTEAANTIQELREQVEALDDLLYSEANDE